MSQISGELRSLGKSAMAFGGAMAGIGASIVAPLLGAVSAFASAGDELNKMSDRTGASVESLSELKYAAAQSGADLATLEGGMRKMQDALGEAANGSDSAIAKFTALGLSVTDLMKMTPDQQFKAIAQGISEIQDPALRTAATIDILGKSGTNLLPMMLTGREGIEQLEEAGRRLGVTMSKSDANAATLFGDTLADLQTTIMSVVNAAGAALAPMLTDILKSVVAVTSSVATWIRENRELFVTIFKVGAGIAAAGSAIAAVGGVLFAAGSVAGIVGAAFTAIVGAIGSVISIVSTVAAVVAPILIPLALVAAALGAGIGYWIKYAESGKAAVGMVASAFQSVMGAVMPWVQLVRDAVNGIVSALGNGDIATAGAIAMQMLKVAFELGKLLIISVWNDIRDRVLSVWDVVVTEASAAIAFVSSLWNSLKTVVIATVAALAASWNYFVGALTNSTLGQVLSGMWAGFQAAGVAAFEVLVQWGNILINSFNAVKGAIVSTIKAVAVAAPAVISVTAATANEDLKASTGINVAGMMAQINEDANAGKSLVDDAFANANKASGEARAKVGGERDAAAEAREGKSAKWKVDQQAVIDRAKAELVALNSKAAIKPPDAPGKPKIGPVVEEPEPPGAKDLPTQKDIRSGFGSFSGAALMLGGNDGGAQARIAKAVEDQKALAAQQLKKTDEHIRETQKLQQALMMS